MVTHPFRQKVVVPHIGSRTTDMPAGQAPHVGFRRWMVDQTGPGEGRRRSPDLRGQFIGSAAILASSSTVSATVEAPSAVTNMAASHPVSRCGRRCWDRSPPARLSATSRPGALVGMRGDGSWRHRAAHRWLLQRRACGCSAAPRRRAQRLPSVASIRVVDQLQHGCRKSDGSSATRNRHPVERRALTDRPRSPPLARRRRTPRSL